MECVGVSCRLFVRGALSDGRDRGGSRAHVHCAADYGKANVQRAVRGILALNPSWARDGGEDTEELQQKFALLAQFDKACSTWLGHWRQWQRLRRWERATRPAGQEVRSRRLFPLSAAGAARACLWHFETFNSVDSLVQFRAGINAVHEFHGAAKPAEKGLARVVVQAARNLKGRPRQQKMRLTVEIVQACVATLVRDDSEVWELVLALYIVLMFVTFNRWVDMTALRIDGMLNRDGWIGLFVGLSKTDQVFKGRWQAIGRTGKFTCPVTLLRRVLRETGWKSGFLFRRCLRRGATRTNEKGARRFQPRWGRSETQCKKGDYNVYRDLFLNVLVQVGGGAWTKKQAAECWGLHSGRVGGASFAAKCGVPGWMRRKMGGWSDASVHVADHYVQQLAVLGSVTSKLGL